VATTVAVVQFAPEKGKLQKNLDRIAELLVQVSEAGASFVTFPEAATTGYFLEGGVVELSLTGQDLANQLQSRLRGKLHRPLEVVIGFYEEKHGNIYNSAAYLVCSRESVECKFTYQKFFLPTYGVFDEDRFVSRGRELGLVDTHLGKASIMICEDVWHSIWPTLNAVAGATIMLIPSASPARGFGGEGIENHDRYKRLVRGIAEEHGVFTILAQLVGFEGGKGFVGGSLITDPFGEIIVEAPVGEESIIIAELDMSLVPIARASTPLISDLQSAWPNIQRIANESKF
jgi:N-carbamoylputrescine amidase